jgi:hypothetical protein
MGFSFFVGETNRTRSAAEKRADTAGLSRIMLAGLKIRHYIGRQAPVKRCLARFAGLAPRVLRLDLEKRVKDCAEIQRKDLKSVGQHLLNRANVGRTHERQLLELTHAALLLRSGKMALAGVHANDLAGRGNLEALGGAAMRFEFLLWLRRISRHYENPLLQNSGQARQQSLH